MGVFTLVAVLGTSSLYASNSAIRTDENIGVEFAKTTARPSADKVVTNVKVFYNPIAEQIAVTFKLTKSGNVAIKVMDALGNEAMSLHNADLDEGIQSLSFDTDSRLAPGFYFVRVTSASETVIKRISIR